MLDHYSPLSLDLDMHLATAGQGFGTQPVGCYKQGNLWICDYLSLYSA
jgi:hypothetical protein